MKITDIINQAQFASWLKTTLGGVVGWAVGKGYVDNDTGILLLTIAGGAIPIVWGWLSNTAPAQIAGTAALPGVEKVITVSEKTAADIPSAKVVSLGSTLRELDKALPT